MAGRSRAAGVRRPRGSRRRSIAVCGEYAGRVVRDSPKQIRPRPGALAPRRRPLPESIGTYHSRVGDLGVAIVPHREFCASSAAGEISGPPRVSRRRADLSNGAIKGKSWHGRARQGRTQGDEPPASFLSGRRRCTVDRDSRAAGKQIPGARRRDTRLPTGRSRGSPQVLVWRRTRVGKQGWRVGCGVVSISG